jgi:type IV pilus assembly protein PilN
MIRINLLPVRAIEAEVGRRQELLVSGVCLGFVTVLILGAYGFQYYRVSKLNREFEALKKEVGALDVQAKGVAELEKKIGDLKGKLKVIDDLNQKKVGPVRVLESLSSATPPRLWITEFKESGGKVSLSGIAIDNQTIADFLKGLSKLTYFKDVDLVETTQIVQDGVPVKKFAVRSTLVYQAAPSSSSGKAGATPATKEVKKG